MSQLQKSLTLKNNKGEDTMKTDINENYSRIKNGSLSNHRK